MTYEEQVRKNMELSEQFSLYALEHPEILEQIPEGAQDDHPDYRRKHEGHRRIGHEKLPGPSDHHR